MSLILDLYTGNAFPVKSIEAIKGMVFTYDVYMVIDPLAILQNTSHGGRVTGWTKCVRERTARNGFFRSRCSSTG